MRPHTLHLADQALAVLSAAAAPMTTREVAEIVASATPLFTSTATTDVRRVLTSLERTGQVRGLRHRGLDIQWESIVVPLPVNLMPPLVVLDGGDHA